MQSSVRAQPKSVMLRRHLLTTQNEQRLFQVRNYSNFSSSPDTEFSGPTSIPRQQIHGSLLEVCWEQRRKVHLSQFSYNYTKRLWEASQICEIVHSNSVKLGFSLEGQLGNAILDLYAKCGRLDLAESVFNRMEKRDVLAWNALLSLYTGAGLMDTVVTVFKSMQDSLIEPNQFTYAMVLSACGRLINVNYGRQVHCDTLKRGLEMRSVCESSLINMYVKCNLVNDARCMFNQASNPSMFSWTILISACVQIGLLDEALHLFYRMQAGGLNLDQVVIVTAIDALVKFGRLEEAFKLFSQMSNPNAVAWNLMISGHAKTGCEVEAVMFFMDMRRAGVRPTRPTLGSVLSAIACLEALSVGILVHGQAIKQGLDNNVYVGSSLINMYAKCEDLNSARKVFDYSAERNLVFWNAMLKGYANNGFPYEVVTLFMDMEKWGLFADGFTYTSILCACGCLGIIGMGYQLHCIILKRNYESNLCVGNALVDMYAKSGALAEARKVFDQMKDRDNVSWNSIIVALVREEMEYAAFNMFQRMIMEGTKPDEAAFAKLVDACANIRDLNLGKQMHGLAVKFGLETGLYAGSSLIDLYVKCQVPGFATKIFYLMPRWNVVSINALIAGYSEHNMEEAVSLYRIIQNQGLHPSEITFLILLDSCNRPTDFALGQQIHCLLLKKCLLHEEILGVCLLSFYMKHQSLRDASKIFMEFSDFKSPVLWTAMISGLNQNGHNEEALELYKEMRGENLMPDQATFASVLKSCSTSVSLKDGAKLHSLIVRTGFVLDMLLCSALIDMYAKCGDMGSSFLVFKELDGKSDVICWNSIIWGLAKNGCADEALKIFSDMKHSCVKPDDVTFLGVLTACSHAGKVPEGRQIFDIMTKHYGIQPRIDHCACMIDLLGRCGLLDEAENFINGLNFESSAMIWASFLGVCKLHGDEVRGQYAASKLMELEPKDSSVYSLLSNIYASNCNWGEVNSLRSQMREKGLEKLPGSSWISRTHSYMPVSVN